MDTIRRALIATHDSLGRAYARRFQRNGYEVVLASDIDEIFTAMGITRDSPPETVPVNMFEKYLMDLNLGSPGSPDITPARLVYAHLRTSIEQGRVKFLGVSGNSVTRENARAEGIPARDICDSYSIDEFVKS